MARLLTAQHSILGEMMNELRDKSIQVDRAKFRMNLERIGEIGAYEISKELSYEEAIVTTPLGEATTFRLIAQPVLATILRAGLPLNQGVLRIFDKADSAYLSAYRKHDIDNENAFMIQLEYISCPDLTDKVLIISDPMVATGASIVTAINALKEYGIPKHIHVLCAIASTEGVDYVERNTENTTVWAAAIDDELTAKGYIVPGLGDAGDLSFGEKQQY
jgi:uracil phosphoribosyltransferase